MPHDKKGQLLNAGDRVILTGIIKSIDSQQETYCNATFVTDRGMTPEQDGTEDSSCFTISARMVEKEEPRVNRDALAAVLGELRALRKENGLLRAKVEVFDVFKAALSGRGGDGMCFSPDPAPELERFLRGEIEPKMQ